MITIKSNTIFKLAVVLIIGCNSSECENIDWHSKRLIHDIYYNWSYEDFGIDKPPGKTISVGSYDCGVGGNLTIISGGIYAVGFDNSFIIAKAHPWIDVEIEESLRSVKNNNGDYEILNLADTIYLLKKGDSIHSEGKDSIYQQNGKWYRKNFFYKIPKNFLGILDYKKTRYYIFDIRNYKYDICEKTSRLHRFDDEKDFLDGRRNLQVSKNLDFTIIDKKIEFEK